MKRTGVPPPLDLISYAVAVASVGGSGRMRAFFGDPVRQAVFEACSLDPHAAPTIVHGLSSATSVPSPSPGASRGRSEPGGLRFATGAGPHGLLYQLDQPRSI